MEIKQKTIYHENMIDIKKNLGSKVKKLRIKEKLTQDKLAEKLNLQTQTITFIETGRSFISCEVLERLSNFFNVVPSYFFEEKDIDNSQENLNYKKEIIALISNLDTYRLKDIYNIILALKNN